MNYRSLVQDIQRINASTRQFAGRTVDLLTSVRNWLIGARIVEYEQLGEDRVAYGTALLENLSDDLSREGETGMSARNLMNFRVLTLTWPDLEVPKALPLLELREIRQTPSAVSGTIEIPQTPSAELEPVQFPQTPSAESPIALTALARLEYPTIRARIATLDRLEWQDAAWTLRLFQSLSFSHLLELTRLDPPLKRAFYELQALKEGWAVKELKRQIGTMLFERVGLSKEKDAVMALSREGRLTESPATLLRDPYVLEFLGLPEPASFTEAELESALIDHLLEFLRELGRDFCFVDRQLRMTIGGEHHYLDLLFFHRALRCLVAIDLKIGDFGYQDAGQMHFYLNYIAERLTRPDENPPVGILLCAGKDAEKVHFATVNLPHQVLVARYLTALPSEEQLTRWLHEEKLRLARLRS